jgi:hypothetical protein
VGRYYDPLTGRFLTRDPIGYAGGLNLYAFAGNNPVSYADPSGTNPLRCGAVGAGIGAIIGGGVAYVHHQDVWQAVERGAVVGGVTGFFTCLGAPELGAGFLGSAASGAVGGAVGDVYGQATVSLSQVAVTAAAISPTSSVRGPCITVNPFGRGECAASLCGVPGSAGVPDTGGELDSTHRAGDCRSADRRSACVGPRGAVRT